VHYVVHKMPIPKYKMLNGNVSVGDNSLFKVNVSDQECTDIQFVNEQDTHVQTNTVCPMPL